MYHLLCKIGFYLLAAKVDLKIPSIINLKKNKKKSVSLDLFSIICTCVMNCSLTMSMKEDSNFRIGVISLAAYKLCECLLR